MHKRYVMSGMAGAVALSALVAVLGVPFFTEQADRIRASGTLQLSNVATDIKQQPLAASPASASGLAGAAVDVDQPSSTVQLSTPAVMSQEEDEYSVGEKRADLAKKSEGREMSAPVAAPSQVIDQMAFGDNQLQAKTDALRAIAPAKTVSESVASRTMGTLGSSRIMPTDAQPQHSYKEVGRDNFKDFEESPVKAVTAEPVSTFSIDVDTSSYSFARKMINQGVLPQKDAVRAEEMINYFDYNYPLADSREQPFKPTIAVYDSPWKTGNKLIHIGIKGYDVASTEKPASNLVFLLDVSGSMNSPDKLPLVKNSLKMLLDTLKADDTVGIVVYAGSAGTVLEPTKASEKQKILDALDRLEAGGSTAGAEGIRQAYNLAEQHMVRDGVNRVILATDGDFNVGITNQEELKDFVERKRDSGIFLSVLGFGQGNYNDSMMQTLAQNGNGNAAYIDTLSEARKVLVQEASSTLFTIAKDVKIQVEFNPAAVQEYRLVGYETRALNREDFSNDKVDAGEIGSGHAVTAIYEITTIGAQPLVDDLRYPSAQPRLLGEKRKTETEYAFLKIRYKLPQEDTSKLIEHPITIENATPFDQLSDDIRFAAAVAGFSQLLKGSKYTGSLTYDQVIETANNARGKDEFGYRSEFVNLVRLAKSAAAALPPQQ